MLIFGEVALHVMGEEEPGNVMSGLITWRESCGQHSALWPDSHWICIIISFLAQFKNRVARLDVRDECFAIAENDGIIVHTSRGTLYHSFS